MRHAESFIQNDPFITAFPEHRKNHTVTVSTLSLITVAIITSSIIKVFESCRLKRNSRSFRKRWLHSSELIENIFLLGTLIRYKSGKDHLKIPSSHIKNDFSITKKRHRASWKLLQKLLQEHLKVGYSFLK